MRLVCKVRREGYVNPRRQTSKVRIETIKKKGERSKLRSFPRDLTLWCPTWFSYLDWAVKTVVPLSGDDQKVVFQAFVGLGKAGYQPHLIGPGLQVI